jgi:endonuclease YncB( thermonuclease family)
LLGPTGLRQLALVAAVLVALGGCSEEDFSTGDEPAATSTRVPLGTEAARLIKHTDGDTFYLTGIGKVRLIGIDTPEVFGEQECFGREASRFVERTVPIGAPVRYRLGVEERDRYGRALAYVWLDDGRFLNRMLVAHGFAQPLTVPPNVEYEDFFVRAARRAREAGRGLWGRPGCSR